MTERSIVIVGGGFSGWLAALALQTWANKSAARNRPRIIVVETPSIPPIGVGESATGLLTDFLSDHDISAPTFIREARATFKLGLELSGWSGRGSRYRAPIDNPDQMIGIEGVTSISQRCALAEELPVDAAHLHGWLMRREKAPAVQHEGTLGLLGTHAWHFDASAAAKCVEKAAIGRGVETVHGIVAAPERRDGGSVSALRLTDGRQVSGDFFLDCTGQRRLFMEEQRSDWTDQSHVIPVNRAVAGFIPHRKSVPVATRAIAAHAGWIWEIPTADRLGVGYVHDGNAIELERAWETLLRHAGNDFVAGPTLRFASGFRRRPWQHNAVAIGMAAGFCEPLQSSSLHIALIQISWIIRALEVRGEVKAWDAQATHFNAFMSAFQEDIADFIALHYSRPAFSNPFWRSAGARARSTVLFRSCFEQPGFPSDQLFQGRSGGVSPNLILPIAGGLNWLDRGAARVSVTTEQRRAARKARELHQAFSSDAMDHETALRRLAVEDTNRATVSNRRDAVANLISEGAAS